MCQARSGLSQRLGDLVRQDGLAGAGLALDQKRPLEGDGGIDGHAQILGRDIGLRAFEPPHAVSVRCRAEG